MKVPKKTLTVAGVIVGVLGALTVAAHLMGGVGIDDDPTLFRIVTILLPAVMFLGLPILCIIAYFILSRHKGQPLSSVTDGELSVLTGAMLIVFYAFCILFFA
jgi:hypothetical protein